MAIKALLIASSCSLMMALVAFFGGVRPAAAQDLKFVNLSNRNKPQATIRCNLYDGDTRYARLTILRSGARLRLPARANKRALNVRDVDSQSRPRLRSWACQVENEGQDNQIYVKRTKSDAVESFALSVSDFVDIPDSDEEEAPAQDLAQACSSISPLPSQFIYKTVGSEHFSDCRRNTAGLVVKAGFPGSFPNTAEVFDTEGNLRAVFGAYYPAGAQWKWRAYACWGDGDNYPYGGAKIAADAKAATGSQNIYLRIGTKCYGPINAAKCYNSSSC